MEEIKTAHTEIRPTDAGNPERARSVASNAAISDPHTYFCTLMGIGNPNGSSGARASTLSPSSSSSGGPTIRKPWTQPLYGRVQSHFRRQRHEYQFTAAVSNSLLLLQILIGAVVTALSASKSPRALTTVFGALNTVIAGSIAYFKSRGQPMRSRAFRDELEACVDGIEDAEARMWGWTMSDKFAPLPGEESVEGPDGEQEQDWRIFVENEVERLHKMYDAALDNARSNFPDLWVKGKGDSDRTGTVNKPDEKKKKTHSGPRDRRSRESRAEVQHPLARESHPGTPPHESPRQENHDH